jgi:hypothetical protein
MKVEKHSFRGCALRRGLKRIQQPHPAAGEVIDVACHHGEIMQKSDGSDLLVDGAVGIGHPQSPPNLGCIAIKVQHPIAVGLPYLSQPLLQQLSLRVLPPGGESTPLHGAAHRW